MIVGLAKNTPPTGITPLLNMALLGPVVDIKIN